MIQAIISTKKQLSNYFAYNLAEQFYSVKNDNQDVFCYFVSCYTEDDLKQVLYEAKDFDLVNVEYQ